ncbi:hypothetical protein E2C01_096595 [Portunus trituberculatus]|uniref:Uncharacterized protein n=1 Tax=Portunus trituberculatus TaxID=210409 RepID=A0A5B7JYC0_PORTR|nr:hypothetical protein [Portunus trituberculatus]
MAVLGSRGAWTSFVDVRQGMEVYTRLSPSRHPATAPKSPSSPAWPFLTAPHSYQACVPRHQQTCGSSRSPRRHLPYQTTATWPSRLCSALVAVPPDKLITDNHFLNVICYILSLYHPRPFCPSVPITYVDLFRVLPTICPPSQTLPTLSVRSGPLTGYRDTGRDKGPRGSLNLY